MIGAIIFLSGVLIVVIGLAGVAMMLGEWVLNLLRHD